MDGDLRQGLAVGLSDGDRAAAERLLELCNRHEGLDLPIDIDPALSTGAEATHFLCYERGELVGLACLPSDPDPEACLMVHPAHRRHGVGRALLTAVRAECRQRGLTSFLLVCDQAARSGPAFTAAIGASFCFAEYRLELDPAAIDRARPRQDALRLLAVGHRDLETMVQILAGAFGDPEGGVRSGLTRMLYDPTRRHYLAAFGDKPVGMLRLGAYPEFADITAFGVLPEYRGRGYGRQMLLDAVDILLAESHERIVIEVETDNQRALGLYTSCGFKVASEYAYYKLAA